MSVGSIPISLLLFTSTKGHFGFRDIYLTTLALLDRQIPLSQFSVKVAHIKISPGEEATAEEMKERLTEFGFQVIVAIAPWSRGTSHGNEYMQDVIRVSKMTQVYTSPYVMWLEDDSPVVCHKAPLERVLARMIGAIESSPDALSSRFIRRGDYVGGVPSLLTEDDHFFSPFTDFQPAVWRARDFYLAAKTIEDNWDRVQGIQCEALWRMVTDPLSRASVKRHWVWLPDYAETIHLGCPEYPTLKQNLLGAG